MAAGVALAENNDKEAKMDAVGGTFPPTWTSVHHMSDHALTECLRDGECSIASYP